MLEFLASVDPMALPIWAILAFSAAMFPIGILLPCSRCCGRCSLCVTGELPETVTVTFSGFPAESSSPGPDLIGVQFSSSFGSGAAARVTAPGDVPGPITEVLLTNKGSGYAKFGRVEPGPIAASCSTGSGATFGVSISQSTDSNGVDQWSVSEVSVSGGSGYKDFDPITFTPATGDTVAVQASAAIRTGRTQPTVTATASGGSGCVLSVETASLGGSPETWRVSAVNVVDGGSGYTNGAAVTFQVSGSGTAVANATAVLSSNGGPPSVTQDEYGVSGSGAVLAYTWSAVSGGYRLSATISSAGSGYTVGDFIGLVNSAGQGQYFMVSSVDDDGAVTEIDSLDPFTFPPGPGPITSVTVLYGGVYFADDGIPASVVVANGGIYYREDASAPPYVADVEVTLSQNPPSNGSGAQLNAVVESNTSSPDFGKIKQLDIAEGTGGGNGYLAWQTKTVKHCCDALNNVPVVLQRNSTIGAIGPPFGENACTYTANTCRFPSNVPIGNTQIRVVYKGPLVPPEVALLSRLCSLNRALNDDASSSQEGAFTTSTLISNCSQLAFTSTGTFRGSAVTAVVAPGGEYSPPPAKQNNCFVCCKNTTELEEEIAVSLDHPQHDGDYVLNLWSIDSRRVWYEESLNNNPTATWMVEVPESDGIHIIARLRMCSTEKPIGGSFDPLQEMRYVPTTAQEKVYCNDCDKKCLTEVLFEPLTLDDADGPGNLGAPTWALFGTSRIGEKADGGNPTPRITCEQLCLPNPQCRPAAGEYVIRSYYWLDPIASVTIQ